jgi:lysyl-tRNA synthetase class 2
MQDSNAWRPSASIPMLRQRADLMARIRGFFNERGYLEVETPVMAQYGVSDVYLSNIKAQFRGKPYCLQTSPEYHMKRLLAAGSGAIFQLARVFRDDEWGRWHNPEFTLLEWYQLGVCHHTLMDEVDIFLQLILSTKPMIRKTYQQAFNMTCPIDPLLTSIADMAAYLATVDLGNVLAADEMDRDQYLFLLMSHVVEPALGQLDVPVAVYDFPASQASLAQVKDGLAERFEVYYRGVELANGFHELTDAPAQRERFDHDNQKRAAMGLEMSPPDHYLIKALENGLPACSGVALGVDRLMALACQKTSIADVMSFDFSRS